MKLRWHIRKAVPEDSVGLQNCMESAYAAYQKRMGGKRLPPMDQNYKNEIEEFPAWVVEYDNNIAGGLIMMFENEYALIANIAVHPELQGRGLGSGLMRFAESKAKEKSYSVLRLATHVLLTENLSLYRHLGWTEVNRDETRVYMRKEI